MAPDFSVADYGWTGKEAHVEAYLLEPLQQSGFTVVGNDSSPSGLAAGRERCTNLTFHQVIASPEAIQALALDPFDGAEHRSGGALL